jgi:3-oxoacyl-[acyl-carrier protein] reductase
MKVELENHVALVTGAGRGIGRAIADNLSANGALVVYADLANSGVEKLLAEPGAPANAMALHMDVTNENQVASGVQEIIEKYGRLDILVNNAGVNTIHNRVAIDQFQLDEWRRVLEVDLTGLFLVSRAVAQHMTGQGSGRIINIASIAGLVPLRLQSAFVAAKAGVVNLTKSMALELGGRGVLVNGVAPGSIYTPATEQLFYGEDGNYKESVQRLLDHIPLGRPGTAQEIADAVLFLAAPESSYINGHILTVDGGWTAGYHRDF